MVIEVFEAAVCGRANAEETEVRTAVTGYTVVLTAMVIAVNRVLSAGQETTVAAQLMMVLVVVWKPVLVVYSAARAWVGVV